jgi:hypothetical protein
MLEGKPVEENPLLKPRSRMMDNIKIDLREMECEGITQTGSSGWHLLIR